MLENLKQLVIDVAQKAQNIGLCAHKAGNFSIRDEETGYVLITPSAIDREKLTIKDICVVDLDANLIEVESDVRPTSEILMHLEAYKTRPDLNAIAHTHSKYATMFAVLNREIKPIIYEVASYGGKVPVAPYGRPGTPELAYNVAKTLEEVDVCLMEKHGVFCADAKDLNEALLKAIYIEEVAHIYYGSIMLNGGKEPDCIPQEELDSWKYPDQVKLQTT